MLCPIWKVRDRVRISVRSWVRVRIRVQTSHKPSHTSDFNPNRNPNMEGPTATRVIRALGYTAPIFGLTGNALDSDVQYFLKQGADRVIPKPFNAVLFKKYMNEMTSAKG
jgi:hypothetical protein